MVTVLNFIFKMSAKLSFNYASKPSFHTCRKYILSGSSCYKTSQLNIHNVWKEIISQNIATDHMTSRNH